MFSEEEAPEAEELWMILLLMASQSIKWNNKKMLYESEQKMSFSQ